MTLSKDILTIDAERVSSEIEDFIRKEIADSYKRKGAVIGLSGGIDSALAAAYCVRAIGKERVFGLLLPEKDSNPVSTEYGVMMADFLGIQHETVDISDILESFGVYEKRLEVIRKYFPEATSQTKFRMVLPQDLVDRDRLNVYYIEVMDDTGSLRRERLDRDGYLAIMAANDIKQRVRMTQLYYEAEKRYFVVCGTTNLSETMQGFFVKYGDGGVDIEPLANLYKTQVYQLAHHLGIPEEIIRRTPSPDTYSLEVSDKEFYFCLPYDVLDLVLYSIVNGLPIESLSQSLGLETEQAERIQKDLVRKNRLTEHLRTVPASPTIGGTK